MSLYSQPTRANHGTASLPSSSQRGYRMCDQCGAFETPAVRFRLCGGCMTSQYCSPDCQKAHWPSHKPICQLTVAASFKATADGCVDENVAKDLRKFTSVHSSLLGWAGFQALQLKRVPANIREIALLIDLSYHSHAESHRRFSIASTRLVSRSYIRDPVVIADIQRREERCKKAGGIGTLIVIIACGTISQVMPVEVDPPAKIDWDSREDWAKVLSHFVDNGRTDFKPISTTLRGVAKQPSSPAGHSPLTPANPNPTTSKLATEIRNTLAGAGDIGSSSHSSVNSPRSSSTTSVPSPITPISVFSDYNTDSETHIDWNTQGDTKHDADKEQVLRMRPPDMVDRDRSQHFQTTTCWIAAEHALQHAKSKLLSVSDIFDRWHIQKSEYIVLAGFDESLIKSGVGYLEQIHVLVSVEVDPNSPLLSELGNLFSPFSSMLLTGCSSYRLPLFKDDGGLWGFDELIYFTASKFADGGLSAKLPLTVIGLSRSPSLSGGPTSSSPGDSRSGGEEKYLKEKSEKGKERDSGGEDEPGKEDKDDDDDSDEPSEDRGEALARPAKISFAIVSKIYPVQDKLTAFQTLTTQGCLTMQISRPAPQSVDPFSTCRVQFTELTFGTHRTTEIAYKQFHVRIVINSQQENAAVDGIKPKRTPASEREEQQLSMTKTGRTRGMSVGLTIGANPQGTITGALTRTNEDTAGLEKKRYTSRITEQHDDGMVEWGFDVDDLHERERGIDMAHDILPTARFEFVGKLKDPPPLPERMVIDITSYWSMIPCNGAESNWIHKFLNVTRSSGNTQATSYSNLCQIVSLEIALPDLPPRSDYRATMHVSPGVPDTDYISYYPEVRLPTMDSVTVTPAFTTDDWRELSTLKLATHPELRLSEYFNRPFGKSGSDTKSQ